MFKASIYKRNAVETRIYKMDTFAVFKNKYIKFFVPFWRKDSRLNWKRLQKNANFIRAVLILILKSISRKNNMYIQNWKDHQVNIRKCAQLSKFYLRSRINLLFVSICLTSIKKPRNLMGWENWYSNISAVWVKT